MTRGHPPLPVVMVLTWEQFLLQPVGYLLVMYHGETLPFSGSCLVMTCHGEIPVIILNICQEPPVLQASTACLWPPGKFHAKRGWPRPNPAGPP